jgi:hypothetical protein
MSNSAGFGGSNGVLIFKKVWGYYARKKKIIC